MNQVFHTDPCGRCGHVGTAEIVQGWHRWEAPPPDCGCQCHEVWRLVHGIPAVGAAA
jgi:hypothetical protein